MIIRAVIGDRNAELVLLMKCVKNLLFTVVLACALFHSAPPALAEDDAFIYGANDVPLMPGLEEVPSLRIVFDKPEGRIIQLFVRGNVSETEVTAFYRETLPQLGWLPSTENSFVRDEEKLIFLFETTGNILTVQLSISPR